jgi:hypothetical protein
LLRSEAVMTDMRPEYRETVENTLHDFVRNGDDVMCVAVFCIQDRTCQVCGHHPITWNYLIENLATHQPLIAGSECIRNYEIVLRDWGYQPEFVVYPTYFARFTRWLTDEVEGNPNSIQVHDRFLNRVSIDSRQYLNSRFPDFGRASLFEYVRPKKEPQPEREIIRICPRCSNAGQYYCDVDGLRGIALTRYQAHRLCALCQAVIRCPKCGDEPRVPKQVGGIERSNEEVPF